MFVILSKKIRFLGTFRKLGKAIISFVMYVYPSVYPHGTLPLQLDGSS